MALLYSVTRSYCCACRTVSRSPFLKNLFDRQAWRAIGTSSKFFSNILLPREQPIIMKLESKDFEDILTTEVKELASIFTKYGFEIRIAGGAVRDLLMNKVPKDLDFATVATPEQMRDMFTKEQIRMINMKGETHGTVTARINDKENFEVTTLRIDTNPDGRHCEVQFTTDWRLDASRRDLTINSMFLGLDGTVYDYFNGYEDLKNRRVVFVGDAAQRIREDYLRIFRYFRFYGRICSNPDAHDLDTLEAIRENAEGLSKISGERIWSELSQTLEGRYGRELLLLMTKLGLSPYMGLPHKPNISQYKELCARCDKPLLAISLLVGLIDTEDHMLELHKRLKLSSYNRDLGFFLVTYREGLSHEKPLLPYQKILIFTKFKISDVKSWIQQTLRYRGEFELEDEMALWEVPRFPVSGMTLRNMDIAGKQISFVLRGLKTYWAENDFTPNADELLQLVPELLRQLNLNPEKAKEVKN